MKRHVQILLASGGALVLLVNVIVLAGVAWNRSGEPEAMLRLSERELDLPSLWRDSGEDSGLALSLSWRVVPEPPDSEKESPYPQAAYSQTRWLDAERLARLGFDVSDRPDADFPRRYHGSAREVWLALELDGPAHARSVARAASLLAEANTKLAEHPDDGEHQQRVRDAAQHHKQVRDEWSRLIAIDADLDPDALRARHPDRQQIAVVHGRVRAIWHQPHQQAHRGRWRGYIEAISIDSIHVPLAMRESFEPLLAKRDAEQPKRFNVTLAYGKRREPWITEVGVDVH